MELPNVSLEYRGGYLCFSVTKNTDLFNIINTQIGNRRLANACSQNSIYFAQTGNAMYSGVGVNFSVFARYAEEYINSWSFNPDEAEAIIDKFQQDYPKFIALVQELREQHSTPPGVRFVGTDATIFLPSVPKEPCFDLQITPRLLLNNKVYILTPAEEVEETEYLQKQVETLQKRAADAIKTYHDTMVNLRQQLQSSYDRALAELQNQRHKRMPNITRYDIVGDTPTTIWLEGDLIVFACLREVIFDRAICGNVVYFAPHPIKKKLLVCLLCTDEGTGYQVASVKLLTPNLRSFLTPHTMTDGGNLCLGEYNYPSFTNTKQLDIIIAQIVENLKTVNLDSTAMHPKSFADAGFFDPLKNKWETHQTWGATTWRDEE